MKNNIKKVIGVIEGDCSNTKTLAEILEYKGIEVIPFSYPYNKDYGKLKNAIDQLIEYFKVDYSKVENMRKILNSVRQKAINFDKLTYTENNISGFENHLQLVSCSDFNTDYKKFENDISYKISNTKLQTKFNDKARIAYIGIPPMTGDLYSFVEDLEARIVYNEVQYEFAFPRYSNADNIYEQYQDYTYPYSLSDRLKEIRQQIELRNIDAVIHYNQAFCHRALESIIVKKELDIPVLNIEGDKLNILDARTKLRLEAFIDMIKDLKVMKK